MAERRWENQVRVMAAWGRGAARILNDKMTKWQNDEEKIR
jgi:hypothetical protein